MLIKRLRDCAEIEARDQSRLREIVNPNTEESDVSYSLAWAQVQPGEQTLRHALDCWEVYYILTGTGIMHINEETSAVNKNDTVFIPPHTVQSIKNTGRVPLEFLCIVNPPWRPDKEHIVQ
jgi:mannose-6-phosphate isomerase-like protein (cupin superfamily)